MLSVAFILLDDGEVESNRLPYSGYRAVGADGMAFGHAGLRFFGLNDYSQRQGHLSCAQEAGLCRHFTDTPPRTIDEVRSHIAHGYEKSCSRSGACRLMRRLGFVYKKPVSLLARADEAEQKAFIADYEALMTGPGGDEMVAFSGAVHPSTPKPPRPWLVSQGSENRHLRARQVASG